MQGMDSACQTIDANREYLERLNFLYWYERFPEEVRLHADHPTYKRLREKYRTAISRIDTMRCICSGLEM